MPMPIGLLPSVWYGTDEMHAYHLRPMFTGEHIWCQMFSEPTHGSDVAGIPGRAVRDGDEWIVNGQKVWTTLAHLSKWGLLGVRTDPQAGKHAGLTAFDVDMQDPTVEIRPLRQMTGEAEFNEVFFSDTRIPDAERLGQLTDLNGNQEQREALGDHRARLPHRRGDLLLRVAKAVAEGTIGIGLLERREVFALEILDEPDLERLEVRTVGSATEADLADVLQAMRERMGPAVEVVWMPVDRIDTTATGKYRFTQSRP